MLRTFQSCLLLCDSISATLIISPPPPFREIVSSVLQHALSLPPPHPVELFTAAMRCFFASGNQRRVPPTQLLTRIPADHKSVIHAFENMQSAVGVVESSSACMALLALAALSSASTTDPSRLHWLQYTRRYHCAGTQSIFFVVSCTQVVRYRA